MREVGRNLFRHERGAHVVEFAMVVMVLFFLMFGIIDFGRAIFAYDSVAHVAREGTRYAIVRGQESGRTATSTEIQAYVRGLAAGLDPNAVLVTTTWSPDKQPGSVVQVQVTYNFQPITPVIPLPMSLTSTSRMVISF